MMLRLYLMDTDKLTDICRTEQPQIVLRLTRGYSVDFMAEQSSAIIGSLYPSIRWGGRDTMSYPISPHNNISKALAVTNHEAAI